ncbi:Putative Holliday junction resolvase [Candidatus Annandia adelgestsuga]|uniref:Putative pre-16S rRNA nuclease n=1 Tax=Candidatus Annandia adelgestsuga TaxID=1302411 RepID=A0A3Q9CLF7_9ENTR|nr:Holliday junction resolvase RuvX [Candidatus Annandia adelgestsuga]AZP36266.1 Putative Holliday junction resolvase [Candidatus Annandia adelgestsuga]
MKNNKSNFFITFISFDFGMKNIGVAVGQNFTCTASPLNSLKVKNGVPDWNDVRKIIKNWKPKVIIVGLPINMNNKEQYITKRARIFAQDLYYIFKIIVFMYDERLTTKEAKQNIFNYNIKIKKKYDINSISAVIILESWFKKYFIKFKKF